MNTPKISVIIPVYNTQDYVKQAIESITKQTLSNIEIIIINDGSTDNSLEIIESIAANDNRIIVIDQENKGQSISRNVGIDKSTGDFIYFMDSDDLLELNALELCYNKALDEKLDFLFFNAEIFYDGDNDKKDWFDYNQTKGIANKVYSGVDIFNLKMDGHSFRTSVCLNLINNSFLKENKIYFYPNIIHEDELFTAHLYLHATRVAFIDRSFFKRRVRNNSTMTKKFSWKNIDGYFTVAQELKSYSVNKPQAIKSTIDKFLKKMLNAAVWQAHVLPVKERFAILHICITRYPSYIHFKTLLVLLFKKD